MSFHDIKITGPDKDATQPTGEGAFYSAVLKLSPHPTSDWTSLFNENWIHNFYQRTRRAEAMGSAITVRCTLPELEDGLLAELKKVVHQTNKQHRINIGENDEKEAVAKVHANAERQNVSDILDRLNFD